MYAIIKSGGKQYRVEPGDTSKVEKLDKNLGDEFEVTEVLAVGGDKTYVGEPQVKGAKVTVVVTNQSRAPKTIVFKKKRRQGYRRMHGHRQFYTELFIKSIVSPDGESKSDAEANVFDVEKKMQELAKTADVRKAKKAESRKSSEPVKKAATKKKTAKKKTAVKKKAVKKKAAKKKTTAKKKTAKKATTKKKAVKKKTK